MVGNPFVICRDEEPSNGNDPNKIAYHTQPSAHTSALSQMKWLEYKSTSSGARYMEVQ